MSLKSLENCWFLTGPTASGKTQTALALAQRLGAEIISMDSMAVYRGLDIGTAKPTSAERAAVPHHLLDVVEPDEDFSLAQYVRQATTSVADLSARGRPALFVGGTPLYLKSLIRGTYEGPPPDWEWRRQVAQTVAQQGEEWLHHRLEEVDPVTAARLHPRDQRRVIRAWEVYVLTGRPLSAWQQEAVVVRQPSECRVFRLEHELSALEARIEARVDAMFAQGLVEEVEGLLAAGQVFGRTASQALGYREVLACLYGQLDSEPVPAAVKLRTRQFAKRQRTWFRSLTECRLVPLDGRESPDEVSEQIWQTGSAVTPASPA